MSGLVPVLIGLLAAAVTNYLADVLPLTRQLTRPICMSCKAKYSLMDYLLIRRCPQCYHARGIRPWLVIVVLPALNVYTWIAPPIHFGYWFGALMLTYMSVVFVIDMEHRLILHPTSMAGCAIAFFAGWYANGFLTTILGGLTGFAIMFAFYYLGVLLSRYRAKRMREQGQTVDDEEALGAGDVILSGILGLALGSHLVLRGIFLGIILAGLFGSAMIIGMLIARRYKRDIFMVFMPYGPFLVLGAFIWIYILSATL
jgi:leader peptidase (prepilin peptidase)/N-methyltransferase